MKTLLQFEHLRIVIRNDKVCVEKECDWCGGHGIDSIDEIQIERCTKCQGAGFETLYVESLPIDLEEQIK